MWVSAQRMVPSLTLQPYMTYFPRADIHELITLDLLHQVIKGVFKDHLVTWVAKYLDHCHRTASMECVLNEINRRSVTYPIICTLLIKHVYRCRIGLVPPFPGLHQFKEGWHFNQWTSDDLKALMKVILLQ